MAHISNQLLNFAHRDPINFPGFQEKDLELQDKTVLKHLISHLIFTFLVEHSTIVLLLYYYYYYYYYYSCLFLGL